MNICSKITYKLKTKIGICKYELYFEESEEWWKLINISY
jgi:hypothetical protein